jgi:putative peptide zinc metalloprotease protein
MLPDSIQMHPLRRWIRRRADLVFINADRSGEKHYVVKDPIALKYFRLREDEAFVLQQSDGLRSPASIAAQTNARFTPRRVSARDIQQLWYAFHREGLVVSDHPSQAQALDDRSLKQSRQRRLLSIVYWPFLRLPGVSPDKWLGSLKPMFDRVLSWPLVVAASILIVLASGVLLTNLAKFYSELPGIDRFFTWSTILLIAICVSIAKVLHELGHAVTCKRFGGECHEIGVLLMLGIPALYCDLSDAWCIPERWKRLLIGAAGMLTEAVLGAIAVLVWVSTHSGVAHSLSHHLVLVCFLGTMLVNANPLLRYDGYFILSDWLNIPNLADEAKARLRAFWSSVIGQHRHPYLPDRSWRLQFGLIFFAIASRLYSFALLASIMWMVILAFRNWGIESVGLLIVGATLLAATSLNASGVIRRTLETRRTRPLIPPVQSVLVYCMLGAGIFTLLLLPIPHNVVAPTLLQPKGLRPVTTTTVGTIQSCLPYGTVTQAGDVLVQLNSYPIDIDLQQAKQQRDLQLATIASIEASIPAQPQLADQLPAAELTLKSIKERLEGMERRKQALTIKVMQSGQWIEPLEETQDAASRRNGLANVKLSRWSGLPGSQKNYGAFSQPGTNLGWIGDTESVEAVAVVPEDQVEWVRVGQQADLILDAYPDKMLPGIIESVSILPTHELNPRLVASGMLPIAYTFVHCANPNGRGPMDAHFQRTTVGPRNGSG